MEGSKKRQARVAGSWRLVAGGLKLVAGGNSGRLAHPGLQRPSADQQVELDRAAVVHTHHRMGGQRVQVGCSSASVRGPWPSCTK